MRLAFPDFSARKFCPLENLPSSSHPGGPARPGPNASHAKTTTKRDAVGRPLGCERRRREQGPKPPYLFASTVKTTRLWREGSASSSPVLELGGRRGVLLGQEREQRPREKQSGQGSAITFRVRRHEWTGPTNRRLPERASSGGEFGKIRSSQATRSSAGSAGTGSFTRRGQDALCSTKRGSDLHPLEGRSCNQSVCGRPGVCKWGRLRPSQHLFGSLRQPVRFSLRTQASDVCS